MTIFLDILLYITLLINILQCDLWISMTILHIDFKYLIILFHLEIWLYVAYNITIYLTIWLHISLNMTIYLIILPYISQNDFLSNYDFISHNFTMYLKVYLYISWIMTLYISKYDITFFLLYLFISQCDSKYDSIYISIWLYIFQYDYFFVIISYCTIFHIVPYLIINFLLRGENRLSYPLHLETRI